MVQFNKEDLDRKSAELKAQRQAQAKYEKELKKAERKHKKELKKMERQKAMNLLRESGYSGRAILFNKKPYGLAFEEKTVYVDYNLLPANENLRPANNSKPKCVKDKRRNCKGCGGCQ